MSHETIHNAPLSGPRWESDQDDGRAGLALACGLAAALAGGVGWAAIVHFSNYEIGWVAWGVGALVGVVMAKTTTVRGKGLGGMAAALAALGLLVGKLLITQWSAGTITKEVLDNPEYLQGAVAWQMYDADELDEETTVAVTATMEAGDTLSDALWAEMTRQADEKLARMNGTERYDLARGAAESYVGRLSVVDSILVQLGPWDLLWFFLAVGTAYRFVGREEQPVSA